MRRTLTVLLALVVAVGVAVAGAVMIGSRPSTGTCAEPAPAGRFTAFPVVAADGNCLQGYAWVPSGGLVKGALVVAHGLHDHARRYEPLALALNEAGVAVYSYDQRGHGASGGATQRIDSIDQAAGDMELVLREAQLRHPGVPLFIYGHSMGGLIAARVAADQPLPLRGAVISSAALKLPVTSSAVQLRVVAALSAVAPGLGLQALDDATLVRDEAARASLAADPQITRDKVPARTVAAIIAGVGDIQERMDSIAVPLLILHGADDEVTEVEGSRELAARARTADKTLRVYDGMLHDLLHEPVAGAVTKEIVAFVASHLQPMP